MQTEITQPAVLATDLALTRLLGAYGVRPDLVMGHSLGEYGALVAAGALSFAAALEAVSARGREMASLAMADNGAMAAVFGPLEEIERIVGGDRRLRRSSRISTAPARRSSAARPTRSERAVAAFQADGPDRDADPGQPRVPHLDRGAGERAAEGRAAPARRAAAGAADRGQRDRRVLPGRRGRRDDARPARPAGRLAGAVRQGSAHAVRRRAPGSSSRSGPKKALHGFVEDVLGDDVLALFTNHPKTGDVASFNQALCGLYAAGLGFGSRDRAAPAVAAEPCRDTPSLPRPPPPPPATVADARPGGPP